MRQQAARRKARGRGFRNRFIERARRLGAFNLADHVVAAQVMREARAIRCDAWDREHPGENIVQSDRDLPEQVARHGAEHIAPARVEGLIRSS